MNVNDEQAALEKADRDIEAARERIERHEALMDELERDGHDIANAERLLAVLKNTLQAMLEYRATIVEQIERLSQAARDKQIE